MNKTEKIIEEIKHLRFWLGVYIAIALTLGSWIVVHLIINFKFVFAGITEGIILFRIYRINENIKIRIKNIGD